MITKGELRERAVAARDALAAGEVAERSARILARVLEVPEVGAAGSVFAYVSSGNEVDTRGLIRALLDLGKVVAVPLIAGPGVMEAHRIVRLEDLAPGRFGILAPSRPRPVAGTPDVTVCPGVAFGPRGERLGRGRAYYDRYLAAHPGTFAIGLAFEVQVAEEVPTEPTDRRMDLIITEGRAIRPPAARA